MKTTTKDSDGGLAILWILFFAMGAGILSSWILETIDLGAEISGLTQGVLIYYLVSMVISAGLLIAYKAPRSVGFFMAFYPFGLVAIFFVGFNSTLADPSEAPNPLADGFAAMLPVAVQIFVWVIPAVVTGYYFYKARIEAPKSACK